MDRLIQLSDDTRETLLLVGVRRHQKDEWSVRDSLEELAQLVATAGGEVVGEFLCRQSVPNPASFVGKGKAGEIAAWVREHGAATVVFDDDLTPAQGRNLEELIGT
ncbi:MAG: GTPase HflX, partial [Kiritimatiellae bacterium]|nr:GTPase HflX [Kiritimatiellia bacterium]